MTPADLTSGAIWKMSDDLNSERDRHVDMSGTNSHAWANNIVSLA
jgi:hypothetical protein